MSFQLDHLIIAVDDLQRATREYQTRGYTVTLGGVHASGVTQNGLVYFADGSYFELLALTNRAESPKEGAPNYSNWFTQGYGLVGYALHTTDLLSAIDRVRSRGLTVNLPKIGGRIRPDGQRLAWQTADLPDLMSPFLIEDVSPRSLRVLATSTAVTHANKTTGIAELIFTIENPTIIEFYQQLLGIVPTVTEGEGVFRFKLTENTTLVFAPFTVTQQRPLFPNAPVDYRLMITD